MKAGRIAMKDVGSWGENNGQVLNRYIEVKQSVEIVGNNIGAWRCFHLK